MATQTGELTLVSLAIYEIDSDPTTGGGFAANMGSLAIADVGGFWQKTSAAATGWTPTNITAYAFGRSGAQTAGSYLKTASGVPSSVVGQMLPAFASLYRLSVTVSAAITGSPAVFQLQNRTAVGTFADVSGASVSIPVGAYVASSAVLGLQLATDQQMSLYFKSGGTPVDPVATLQVISQT